VPPADRSGPEHPGGSDPAGGAGRRGGRPSLGPRKGFPLRLSPELMEQLRAWAAQDMRSLNAHIEYLLRDALRRRRGRGSRED